MQQHAFKPIKISVLSGWNYKVPKWIMGSVLKHHKVPFTFWMLEEVVKNNNLTSLQGVGEALKAWGITAKFTPKTPDNQSDCMAELYTHAAKGPVLSSIVIDNVEKNIFISQVSDEDVTFVDSENKFYIKSKQEFESYPCFGFMTFECQESPCEPNYEDNIKAQRADIFYRVGTKLGLAIVLIAAFTWQALLLPAPVWHLALGGILIAGIILTAITIIYKQNPAQYNAFCKQGAKVDCALILTSPQSKVLGISLTTYSLIFYVGGLALISFIPVQHYHNAIWILFGIHLLSLPVTVYSLYFQKRIIKRWCPLCLLTTALLWLGAAGLVFAVTQQAAPQIIPLLQYGFFSYAPIALILIAWFELRDKHSESAYLALLNQQYMLTPYMIDKVVRGQPKVNNPKFPISLRFGNADAANSCLLIIGADCPKCAEILCHELDYFERMKEMYTFEVVFHQAHFPPNNEVIFLVLQLLASNHEAEAKSLMLLWYQTLSKNPFTLYSEFKKQHNLPDTTAEAGRGLMTLHYQWLRENNIIGAPMMFVNQHSVPLPFYNIETLLYHSKPLADLKDTP